jgi:aspartate carbamoyltransferase catalytic subunit
MKHLLGIRQMEETDIEKIFLLSKLIEEDKLFNSYNKKTLISFFGEPSTRTRFSFEAAAKYLGMNVLTAADASVSSSLKKGESWKDTFRTLSQYGDIIVCRHADRDWTYAANWSRVPVINAGNGDDEHPTQALLDLYTIKKEIGRLDNLRVMVCGDLRHGRTVNSLLHLLHRYKAEIFMVPAIGRDCTPTGFVGSPTPIKYAVRNTPQGMCWRELDFGQAEDYKTTMDVVYMTRMQTERRENNWMVDDYFKMTDTKNMKEKSIILHPLPRGDEISTVIDDDPRAAYHERQVKNGLTVRIALLKMLLDG